MSKQNLPIVISILVATVLLSGSIIFLALKEGSANLNEKQLSEQISKGIENYVQAQVDKQNAPIKVSLDDDPAMGNKKSPLTVVEFSDFECPACRMFFEESYTSFKKDYIDKGLVYFVLRDLPISSHPDAIPAALAANCAREQGGDEMFFKYHDLVFLGQGSAQKGIVPIPDESLKKYAADLGLDTAKFNKCFSDQKYKDEVANDLADAVKYKVGSTPTFFLNGVKLEGAYPYADFKTKLDEAIALTKTK